MNKIINVLIVDDHPIILTAYRNILDLLSINEPSYAFKVDAILSISEAVRLVDKRPVRTPIDLLLLDISLPECSMTNIASGEELGNYIKAKFPDIKIIAITSLNDNYRLINIIKKLNPSGLMVKSDLDNKSLTYAIDRVLKGHKQYSASIDNLLGKRMLINFTLDDIDLLLLKELSNGSKMKELEIFLPITASGIDKRKRLLRDKFGIKSNSDRDLVLSAKSKGFI